MAKRFSITDGVAYYEVGPGMIAQLALEKAFVGWSTFAKNVKDALEFSIKTALRNCTAGKMETDEEKAAAFKAIETRCKALENQEWNAKREGGSGEGRESVLARAIAFLKGTDVAIAIAYIDDLVDTKLEENGIDADADVDTLTDDEKTKRSKLVRGVKKILSDDPGVALEMAKIKREDAVKKEAELIKANAGKPSAFGPAPTPTPETPPAP